MFRLTIILVAFFVFFVCSSAAYDNLKGPPMQTAPIKENIRGITIAPIEDSRLGDVGYGSDRCFTAIDEIAALGATWVSLTPFGRMDDINNTDILHDFEIPVERNEELIKKTAAYARAAGLKIALIPHIYVMSGKWRGDIDPGNDEGIEKWFSSYESFCLRFAHLAADIDADLFSIGVEFKSTTNTHADNWREIIALAREVYKGPITYSANWDEVEYVEFWDALDFIGINAFWPLASKPGDGFIEMLSNAKTTFKGIEGLSLYWNKKVIFTEFGIKSALNSALAPWEWPEDCSNLVYDEAYQATAYQAVFEAVIENDWFEGLFIWKYFSDPFDETQEEVTGFSPRAKQAEQILNEWFRTPWS